LRDSDDRKSCYNRWMEVVLQLMDRKSCYNRCSRNLDGGPCRFCRWKRSTTCTPRYYSDYGFSTPIPQSSLITINGGDYAKMRIHCPPPATVASATVACLDLAKNFKAEGLYHLLHLRYGCPGMKQMEMILKGGKTRGVPANVTIPEFFRCPVCDKEKTNSLPATGVSNKTYLFP
jgi:hypothetical protein